MPKPSSADLFDLVKSMTKGEKKHFKLFISKEADSMNTNVVKLFDAINAAGEYDEKKIITGARIKGNIPALKHYLTDQVTKSLLIYHAEDASDIRIKNMLVLVQIFRYKRLFKQCYALLERAEKLAERTENYTAWLEISDMFTAIASDKQDLTMLESRLRLKDHENGIIEQMLQLKKYRMLGNQIRVHHLRNAFAITSEMMQLNDAVVSDPLLASPSQAGSVRSRVQFYSTMSVHSFSKGDFENASRYAELSVMEYENNPFLIEDETVEYYQKLVTLLIAHGRWDRNEQKLTIEKLRGLLKNPRWAARLKEYEGMIWFYTYSAEFSNCFYQEAFKEAYDFAQKLESTIESYKLDLAPRLLQIVYYNISCLYFCLFNYKETQKCLTKVLQMGFNERTDTEFHSRLVQLVCSYESGDYDFAESSLRKLKRFAARFNQYPVFMQEFAPVFLQLLRADSRKKRMKIFMDMRNILTKIQNIPGEKLLMQAVYIERWIQHKLSGY